MATVKDVRAAHVDGHVMGYQEFQSTFPRPRGDVLAAEVDLGDGGGLRVILQPERGEQIRVFKRRGITVPMAPGQPMQAIPDVAVIEIVPDPDKPDRFVRLYLGPEAVLTTRDL